MAKVMQLYGLSTKETLKLTDAQVQLMQDTALDQAARLIESSPEFQKALSQRLVPLGREIRSQLGDEETSSTDPILGPPPKL